MRLGGEDRASEGGSESSELEQLELQSQSLLVAALGMVF